tara:strand:+ start:1069 stop:1419 length:351 start_codon:yes stop_codon:yes gene_type:complete
MVVLAAGSVEDPNDTARQSGKVDHQSRLNAATHISDVNNRNRAFVDVALDAARDGEGEIAKQALSSITDAGQKMRAARDAAEALADVGQGESAIEVANMISDPAMRDDTLRDISQD